MNIFFQPADQWPIKGEYDVVVVGAGPSGIGAACAAGRLGANVIIIEKYGFPGGVATAAGCPYLMGFAGEGRQIIGGIADELVRELDKMGEAALRMDPGAKPDPEPIGNKPIIRNVLTSVEGVRVASNRLLDRSNVKRLYYTSMIGAVTEGDAVTAVVVDRVDGPGLIKGKCFVDATGDANLVWRAGGKVREYSVEDSMTKTLLIRIGGVKEFYRPDIEERFKDLVKRGLVPLREQDRFMGMELIHPGEVLLNFTLVSGNALDAEELTKMDVQLREQALVAVEWFKKEFASFRDSYLINTASAVGVRAGRGIVGHETITREDIDQNTKVEEPVILATRRYGGHYVSNFEPPWRKVQPGIRPVPWKTLIPVSFSNVVVGGRAISCEPQVIDTFRLMARCIGIGQAAGVTAALAANEGVNTLKVGYQSVRKVLLEQGAILS